MCFFIAIKGKNQKKKKVCQMEQSCIFRRNIPICRSPAATRSMMKRPWKAAKFRGSGKRYQRHRFVLPVVEDVRCTFYFLGKTDL